MTPSSPEQGQPVLGAPWLIAAIATITVGFGGLLSVDLRHGTLRDKFVTQTITWYLVAFVGFVAAGWINERRPIPMRWVWIFAIVLRLVMLTTTPTLSDDVYRYLWDGHLVSEGVNPYAFAIDDPAGDPYDIDARALANNRNLSSPYLPTTHAVFGAAALALPSNPLSLQLVMVGFDLLTAFVVVRLLALARLPRRRLLLYLWNPFVIVEIAHGAHLDALMVALTTAGLLFTLGARRGSTAGPALIALATLTRPIPALLTPVLFWTWSWRQRFTYGAVALALVIPFGIRPGFGLRGEITGTGVFGSARAYTDTFRFNASVYHWFETWVLGLGLDDKGWDEPRSLTRLVIAVVVVVVLAVVALRARSLERRGQLDVRAVLRLSTVPLAAYVLLTPVFHPWYGILLITMSIFVLPGADEPGRRWFLVIPWVYLSGAAIFSYLTYADPNAHAELVWVRRLEWFPTIGLLLAVTIGYRWLRSQTPPLAHSPEPSS